MSTRSDTVDVADVLRTLSRQWRAVSSFIVIGALGALAVVLFAPKRYQGRATVLARSSAPGGGSVLGRMSSGGISELLGSLGGTLGAASLETELQVLKSRAIAGQVVDSLELQFRVREPAGLAPQQLIANLQLETLFDPHSYAFTRTANGTYRVNGDDVKRVATPGEPARLDVGLVTLAARGLPDRFAVKVYDRDDAITRFLERVEALKAGGEIAKITYLGDDSVTAAQATNALVSFYLQRQRTVDRGTNQRRLEYVTTQVNQTANQLEQAEQDLRRYQEATHIFDADIFDKAQLEAELRLRESLTQLEVDEASLGQLLAQADKGQLSSRDLAAYPAFMRGSAVTPLVTQLSDLETARTRLLERRTERDPEVVAIDQSLHGVNTAIAQMARSYESAISRQRAEFQARLDTAEQSLRNLPAANERVGRLTRDVLRLTQLYTALQAQLVEAKLAAIGEGGDVRQIDFASVSRKPWFPQPLLTMGIGISGGLVAGIIAALLLAWFGRWLRDPIEIERLTGVSATRLQPNAPLLVGGTTLSRTLLVVPLDDRAQAHVVAERLARTASARMNAVKVLHFGGNGSGGNGSSVAGAEMNFAREIDQLETQSGMIVVQLPVLSSDATLAALRDTRPVVLVASPGPVDRAALTTALDTLRRMNIPCAGIVISDERRGRARAR